MLSRIAASLLVCRYDAIAFCRLESSLSRNWLVVSHGGSARIRIARSRVISPPSTVSMHTFSRFGTFDPNFEFLDRKGGIDSDLILRLPWAAPLDEPSERGERSVPSAPRPPS